MPHLLFPLLITALSGRILGKQYIWCKANLTICYFSLARILTILKVKVCFMDYCNFVPTWFYIEKNSQEMTPFVCDVCLCSEFKDIFDMKYFIQSLRDDVHIVEALPAEFANIEPVTKAPISWSKVILEKLALVKVC